MNHLKLFSNPEINANIRVISDNDGNLWFVAKDVCAVLDIKNSRDAIASLDDEKELIDLKNTVANSDGIQRGNPKFSVISESGLYNLIFKSNKPNAKKFKRWVTHEVLPSIRQNAFYSLNHSDVTLHKALDTINLLSSQLLEQSKIIANLKQQPQDNVDLPPETFTVSEIAKEYGFDAHWLNNKLRQLGVQYRSGTSWFLYPQFSNLGYTLSVTIHGIPHSFWTAKGRDFIHQLLLHHGYDYSSSRLEF